MSTEKSNQPSPQARFQRAEGHSLPAAPTLAALLREAADDLVSTLEHRLGSAAAPHYRDAAPQQLHERCARLVAALLEATASNAPWAFAAYVRRITEERIDEGYHLDEMQLALSVLEARAWQLTVERSGPASPVQSLAFVTSLVGQAKDELARAYLAHKQRSDVRVAELQRRLDELFKGTERPVSADLVETR